MQINVVNKYKHKATSHDFYCGRGKNSVLGNPYTDIKDKKTKAEFIVDSREEAIIKHKQDFLKQITWNKDIQKEINKMLFHLKGNGVINLVCYCAPKSCHCDNIKEYLLERIEKSQCKHCYDVGESQDGSICICVRKWDIAN